MTRMDVFCPETKAPQPRWSRARTLVLGQLSNRTEGVHHLGDDRFPRGAEGTPPRRRANETYRIALAYRGLAERDRRVDCSLAANQTPVLVHLSLDKTQSCRASGPKVNYIEIPAGSVLSAQGLLCGAALAFGETI